MITMPPSQRIKSIVAAFRPKTLTAALVPCVTASLLALGLNKEFHGTYLLWALLSAISIQIGTNLINDAFDFKKGADTEERLGPQRITQAGVLRHQQVFALGSIFFLMAVGFGVPLVLRGGWPLVAIGLISVIMGYAYTAGPFPLAYVGLGDLFVILFFGTIAVGGMYYLQTLQWNMDCLVLGLQIGFLATVLIAINNLRDRDGDNKVGKKTMAVRFGEKFSKYEITFLCFAPFVLNIYWMMSGHWTAGLLPWFALPLALNLVKNIWKTAPGREYNSFLGQAAALHLLFGIILGVGFLW
jgi:1,4-dihydroxy-2-naphthoate octaprenyltransferase